MAEKFVFNTDTGEGFDLKFDTDTGEGLGPTTPGGVSLTPVEIEAPEVSDERAEFLAQEDFARQQSELGNQLGSTGFVIPDLPDVSPPTMDDILGNLSKAAETQEQLEDTRVEDVLKELVPNYGGSAEAGVLSFGDRDTLARMPRFEQREAWFKRKYPQGNLFRIKTGTDGDLVEMYRTAPDGKAYRVSDDVLSFADAGAVTGSLVNFTTAGSVLGSFFSPLLGTATGAYLGASIDEYIANSLADGSMISDVNTPEEFKTKLLSGDRAALALMDGFLTKALPIAGRSGKYLANKALGGDDGTGSLLYELGFFSVSPKALEAQKSAQRLTETFGVEIEPLNIMQLSDSVLLRGIASQATGTANKLPQNLSNQEARLLQAIQNKAKDLGGYEKLSDGELLKAIQLTQKQMADEVQDSFRVITGGNTSLRSVDEAAESLVQNAKNIDEALSSAIDTSYKKAFSLAGADNVTFNITPLIEKATQIEQGLLATARPAGGRTASGIPLDEKKKFAKEQATQITGLDGDLVSVINLLKNTLDPTLQTVKQGTAVKGTAGKTAQQNVDAFQQLKVIRDKVGTIIGESKSATTQNAARELRDSIDDLIVNGVEKGLVKGGSDAWRKAYLDAGQLVKTRSQAKQYASLGKMVNERSEVLPQTLADELLSGSLNAEQFRIIKNLANTTALNEAEKQTGQALIRDIREYALSDLIRDPSQSFAKIENLRKQDGGKLFNEVFPANSPERAMVEQLELTARKLATDPAQDALKFRRSQQQQLMAYVENLQNTKQDLALQDFINANGGVEGEASKLILSGLINKILVANTQTSKTAGDKFASDVVNAETLSEALGKMRRQILGDEIGEYSIFKPIFGEVQKDGSVKFGKQGRQFLNMITDTQLYTAFLANTADVGGPFATGAIRSAVTSGKLSQTLGAAKSLFTNRLLSDIFGQKPTVSQLERAMATNKGSQMRKTRMGVTLLNQFADGLDLEQELPVMEDSGNVGQESPGAEVQRTGSPPQMGNKMPTASLDIPSLPLASTPRPTGASSTNFQSLFPRDELGGAIASRKQGIMGLA